MNDEEWVDELAGRPAAGAPSAKASGAARVEATTLRDALRAREARTARGGIPPAADLAREAQLIERARTEGLIGPRRSGVRWAPWLAAAAVGGLAVGLVLQMRAVAPLDALPAIERAGPAAPFRIESPEPAALKQQLLSQLRAAGIEARGYESLGAQGIDADLPSPLPDAVRQILQSHGIPVPEDGVLLVEIVASGHSP